MHAIYCLSYIVDFLRESCRILFQKSRIDGQLFIKFIKGPIDCLENLFLGSPNLDTRLLGIVLILGAEPLMDLSHLSSVLLDLHVNVSTQVLHLEEPLIDEGLSLPDVDVLADHVVDHFGDSMLQGKWYVVPGLVLEHLSQRMGIDVHLDFLTLKTACYHPVVHVTREAMD